MGAYLGFYDGSMVGGSQQAFNTRTRVTFGSFLDQMDEAFWVNGSSGSLKVTQLQCCPLPILFTSAQEYVSIFLYNRHVFVTTYRRFIVKNFKRIIVVQYLSTRIMPMSCGDMLWYIPYAMLLTCENTSSTGLRITVITIMYSYTNEIIHNKLWVI